MTSFLKDCNYSIWPLCYGCCIIRKIGPVTSQYPIDLLNHLALSIIQAKLKPAHAEKAI